jgi:hypothetical protein
LSSVNSTVRAILCRLLLLLLLLLQHLHLLLPQLTLALEGGKD